MHIPTKTIDALQAWRNGDPSKLDAFTWALVQNDLIGAIEQADHIHLAFLKTIVQSIENELIEVGNWGSEEKCKAWAAQHGNLFPTIKSAPIVTTEKKVPGMTILMLRNWASGEISVGTPWTNILGNDLLGAVYHTKMDDLVALPATIRYMKENLPPESFGSNENVSNWVNKFRRHFWIEREDFSSYCMMCESNYEETLEESICPGEPFDSIP